MRRLLLLALLGASLSATAQVGLPVIPSPATRSLKDAMISQLSDPKTQVAIGVTSTQVGLMEVRLAENALKTSLDLVAAATRSDDAAGAAAFSATFSSSSAKALYPYLAANQVAKLRRLTLARQPLVALGTEEVAFALSLSDAQRKAIETIRAAQAKALADPSRPSIRFLSTTFAKLSKEGMKNGEDDADEGMTPEKVDGMRPLFAKLFRALEESYRMAAKEPAIKTPDPLKLLTAAQRRRYRELAGDALRGASHAGA